MTETWLNAPGFEDLYEVSDSGRVRSKPRTYVRSDGKIHTVRGEVLRDHPKKGYRTVTLYTRDSEGRRHVHPVWVHRLVLVAFRGDRSGEGLMCRHLDDDKMNTALGNLEWGTASDNAHDAVRNGRHRESRKTHCPRGHALTGSNLVRAQLANGRRACRSCGCARSAVQNAAKRGEHLDFREVADVYFRKFSGM